MKTDRIRQFAIGFLLIEAVGATLWWLMLWLFPSTRSWFLPPNVPEVVLLSFLLPDLIFFIGAAIVAAWGFTKKRAWAWPILCAHCGGVWYATFFTFALCWWERSVFPRDGYVGVLLMTPCAIALTMLVWQLRRIQNQT